MQHATYGTSFVTNKLMEPHLLTIINPMLNLTNMLLNQRTHLGATIFLSKPPGICGQPRIVEVGGVPYLVPTVKMEKLYDMKQFPDPDAWVTGCEHIHAPAPADRPRGLSNTTANKQGRLNRAHAPRRDVTQLGSDNAVSLTCNQAKVARQPAESASDGVLSSSTPASYLSPPQVQ